MNRAAIAAIAASAAIGLGASACGGSSPAHHNAAPPVQPRPSPPTGGTSGSAGGASTNTNTWTLSSCQVEISTGAGSSLQYLPDNAADFQQYQPSAGANPTAVLVAELTWVNNTGGASGLPTNVGVTFTDSNGNYVGQPMLINNASDPADFAWGMWVNSPNAGSGIDANSLFNPGQTIVEAVNASQNAPQQSNLACTAS